MKRFAMVVVLLTAVLATGLAQGPAKPVTVLEGVYTVDQAERGHVAYETYCVGCHEGLEADGPELMGRGLHGPVARRQARFAVLVHEVHHARKYARQPRRSDLYGHHRVRARGQQAAGGPDRVADRHCWATSCSSVSRARRPLANLSIVRAVGCLTSEANNAWSLVKAGTMVAVRHADRRGDHAGGVEAVGRPVARRLDVSADERDAEGRVVERTQGAGQGRPEPSGPARSHQRHVAGVRGGDLWCLSSPFGSRPDRARCRQRHRRFPPACPGKLPPVLPRPDGRAPRHPSTRFAG